ncbi:MAG: 2TM domain-containing protein [Defluviitaleaceae bacterium]|nr:2TM domain-containing protein [Defluviitaleaceae bacterium]
MEPEITVFDNKNNHIGKTFARRAKQLVSKGRAVWMDDSQRTVILIGDADISEIYAPNGGGVVDLRDSGYEHDVEESNDDLLRHLARERVRRKKMLRWHIVGLVAISIFTLFFFLVATNGFAWRTAPVIFFMFGIFYGAIAVWGVWIGKEMVAVMMDKAMRGKEVEKEFQRLKSTHIK